MLGHSEKIIQSSFIKLENIPVINSISDLIDIGNTYVME